MKRAFVIFGLLCASLLSGCTEEQIDQGEQILTDANSVAEGLSDFADGPAGVLLPPGFRAAVELVGISAAAALGVWQKHKHRLTKDALRAVAAGVENVKASDSMIVKSEVHQAMVQLARDRPGVTYAKLNAEVDKAKA